MNVIDARRATVQLTYNGANISEDIAPFLLDYNYTDNAAGKADDLQLSLQDKRGLWRGDWYPSKGAKIKATIITEHWEKPGQIVTLPCGEFEIDSLQATGPPDTVNIKGVSVPVSSNLRGEKKSKAWEKISLSQIGAEIAGKAGLAYIFEADTNPKYDRQDQVRESDLAFLLRLAQAAGLALKVTSRQIVFFDEEKYEGKSSVRKLVRGQTDIISYDFGTESSDTYSEAEVSYQDPETGEDILASYKPSNGPKVGQKLTINERPVVATKGASKAVKIEAAKKHAKKKLRDKNKKETVATFAVTGDPRLVSGVTVEVSGWGVFDGKYIIETATHTIGNNGYTVSIKMRKVLEGY